MIKLGLRIRFFLYSNTVIAVTMILVTVFGMMYQRRVLYDGIVERGRDETVQPSDPLRWAGVVGLQHRGGDLE